MRRRAALTLLLVAACGGGERGEVADAGPRVDAAPGACEPVLGEPELELEFVAGGFDRPVHVVAPPGGDEERLFVLEQHTGRVRIVRDGVIVAQPFLDIGDEVAKAMEQGLLSLAFHPRFAENRRFFISYTRPGNALVVEAWTLSASDPDRADESSREELLIIEQSTAIHSGGRIAFGPDGYLYLGKGDGGPMFDTEGHAQDLGSLRGKFLRLDVDRRDPGLAYAVPPENPFVTTPGARGEIYALGVRNPWGWSIDPATGHLYFGDVGLARWEEVDVIPASTGGGGNYGWPVLLGNECVDAGGCDATPYQPPLTAYSYANLQLCAVIGGHVYRGCRMPGHHGRYFFSDFCASFVRSFRWSELDGLSAVVEHTSISDRLTNVSGIGVDARGELLLLDWEQGEIWRVVPAAGGG